MTDTKPAKSYRPIATHLAVFLLGVIAGAAWHPCTVITATPDDPATADETGSP